MNAFPIRRSVLIFGVPALLVIVCAAAWLLVDLQLVQQQNASLELQAKLARSTVEAPQSRMLAPVSDFSKSLHGSDSSQQTLARIRQAAEMNGVFLLSVKLTEQPAAPTTLGRQTADLGMRGAYSAFKDMFADLLSDGAGQVVLQSLSYRRQGTSLDLEGRAQLLWLSRPTAKPSGVSQ